MLSHMRGFTTLISHIFGSHPAIAGYREFGISYQHPRDLHRLHWEAFRESAKGQSPQFCFDKLLHGHFEITDTILKDPKVHIVITIREPLSTISSLLKLSSMSKYQWTVERAIEYYQTRLKELVSFAQHANSCNKPILFFRADDLISETDASLTFISEFFQLEQPLSEEYNVFKKTGEAGFGDPSENIHHGKINRNRPTSKLDISAELKQSLTDGYQETITTLTKLSNVSSR